MHVLEGNLSLRVQCCCGQYSCSCVRKKASSFLSWCNFVVANEFLFVLEGKIVDTSFLLQCDVVVNNELVLVLEGKLVDARFPS